MRDRLARHVPLLSALAILGAMFAFGAARYEHFASLRTITSLFAEYSFVGIAAVGATFVILAGGIDLSVGAVIAATSIFVATRVEAGWHPLVAFAVALPCGALLGTIHGWLIRAFELPAFIVTLAGMYAVRALGFVIAPQNLAIDHPFLTWSSRSAVVELGDGATLPLRALAFVFVLAVGIVVATRTPFGRHVFAIGGSEKSARSMGLPVSRRVVQVYALAGLCSAAAGCVFTLYKSSGDPASAVGLELDVIAAVVIGGTLLSGGVGSVAGTLVGVLILGLIRTLIDFEGTLDAAWTSVAIGVLLLVFVGLQHRVTARLSARAPST